MEPDFAQFHLQCLAVFSQGVPLQHAGNDAPGIGKLPPAWLAHGAALHGADSRTADVLLLHFDRHPPAGRGSFPTPLLRASPLQHWS